MLGWWTDESKGYRLEDLETPGKLISSRDVDFIEDSSPNDLAIIDNIPPPPESIDNLVDNAISTDSISPSISTPDPSKVALPESRPSTPPSPAMKEMLSPPLAPKKASKWLSLPKREPSSRNRQPPTKFNDENQFTYLSNTTFAFISTTSEPRTLKEALLSPHSKQWEKAIESEFNQLVKAGVFEWIDCLPNDKKAVGSHIVFKEKLDGHGKHIKFKAWIVAQGFSQVPGLDFTETFSSVARFTTLRIFLALTAFLNLELHQVDVVGAYLQGDLDEEIYMKVPDGLAKKYGSGQKFWRLKKALYGLKQAGRQWKKRLHQVMTKLGFTRAIANDCLYVLWEHGKIVLMVLIYVDDMAVAGKGIPGIVLFKQNLSKDFEITDLGELRFILGILVTRDRSKYLIFLNQSAYITQVLARFGMLDAKPVSTPLPVKHGLSISQSPSSKAEEDGYIDFARGIHYLSLVGSLLYATQTHPDIQFSVNLVAQFSGNPGIPHLEAAKCILRYLKGTQNFSLILGQHGRDAVDIVGWTDSDWAGDVDSRRSVGGFVFDVAGGCVSWSSKKQVSVATSSVEAEYVASANATKEAVWLRTLLKEVGYPQHQATIIHADNQGAIALARNPTSHSRAKHIDICFHFIRERIEKNEIKLQYISTHQMVADILTKALPREAFEKFRKALGVVQVSR